MTLQFLIGYRDGNERIAADCNRPVYIRARLCLIALHFQFIHKFDVLLGLELPALCTSQTPAALPHLRFGLGRRLREMLTARYTAPFGISHAWISPGVGRIVTIQHTIQTRLDKQEGPREPKEASLTVEGGLD